LGRTLIEKIIAAHTEDEVAPGGIVWMDLDLRTARDFGGANVVGHFKREYQKENVDDPAKTFFTFDCNVPANTIPYADNQMICRLFAREQELKVYDVDAGIGSHVIMEQGLCVPGCTVVGTDSHLNIVGAVGAFGQGMGDADIAFTFRTGRTWFQVPPTIRIEVSGELAHPATAKDLTLAVTGLLGASGALGAAVEYHGEAIEDLDLDERITLSSMATEVGAIAGLIPPNTDVMAYCRKRSGRDDVEPVWPDADAEYVRSETLDASAIRPMVSRPGAPSDVVPVRDVGNVSVDSVFIGSCTNGRASDFESALGVFDGRSVASGVMCRVVPATMEVWTQMLDSGMIAALNRAGVIVSNPGCGGCASGQIGMTGYGEVQVSTSNRNFHGKQGHGETYLASPLTAAASAVLGRIASADML
jgi:3-isopropylmalate/(R)-2-methylmalate dehydratase large subunit